MKLSSLDDEVETHHYKMFTSSCWIESAYSERDSNGYYLTQALTHIYQIEHVLLEEDLLQAHNMCVGLHDQIKKRIDSGRVRVGQIAFKQAVVVGVLAWLARRSRCMGELS